MNSSFYLKEGWSSGSQYDIGVAQYLNHPDSSSSPGLSRKASSSICDEFKILVEPSLFARRVDGGKLSNEVERLFVEPHVLYVSSELVTSQLLAREEKLREKRQQKLQQQTIADNEEDVVEEGKLTLAETTPALTSLKRKRLQEKSEKVKKLKVSENQTPTRQQPIIQTEQLNHATTPPKQQQSDTVVVRLSSGQVVRLPRALLEKVNPTLSSSSCRINATSTLVDPRTVPVKVCDEKTDPAVRFSDPSTTQLPVSVSLGRALEILQGKSCEEIKQDPAKTNGLVKQLPVNGTSRFVKIRAYQGPSTAPTVVDSASPSTSSLSEQLTKIQQMPPTLVVPRTTAPQTFTLQQQATTKVPSGSPFHVTRIVKQQQSQNIVRRNIVISSPAPVVQMRPATQQYVLTNGAHSSPIQQSTQSPMKICFIHSPRKADGTPLSPGSASPGILVMNPPSNLRQINIDEVLKALSMQNAATTAANAAKLQQSSQQSPA